MRELAAPLERVVRELTKLPGIGRKTGVRLALHLMRVPAEDVRALAQVLGDLRDLVRACEVCFHLGEGPRCSICSDASRDVSSLCVVEDPTNLLAIERSGAFRGVYHVLGGALSPLRDVGPDQLRVRELVERIGRGEIREVILATNPNVEGEATAVYLSRLVRPLGLRVTRLAQGLPAGGELEFTDDLTLRRAVENRREY
jgi:recombination protein RecR